MPAPAQTSTEQIVTAARRLLEERGADALTMRDVAAAVGVRAPSLYKRVRDRTDLLRLVLESVADELAAELAAVAGSGDAVTDLKAMANAYRAFARANPEAWALMNGVQAQSVPGSTERAARSARPVIAVIALVAGEQDALPAARTLVPWIQGFLTMELADAFHLGGDLEDAWDFGLTRLLAAISRPAR